MGEKIYQRFCVHLRNITFKPANKSSDGNNISIEHRGVFEKFHRAAQTFYGWTQDH